MIFQYIPNTDQEGDMIYRKDDEIKEVPTSDIQLWLHITNDTVKLTLLTWFTPAHHTSERDAHSP